MKLAEAFGMAGLRVTDKAQVEGAILRALAHPGPVLIDFQVDPEECVYPDGAARRRPVADAGASEAGSEAGEQPQGGDARR